MSKILVIAAHLDDEVLGCGGTIAKLVDRGNEVSVMFFTKGRATENLFDMSKKAGIVLGINRAMNHSFTDQMLDTIPLLDIIACIDNMITEVQPNTIFTHSNCDLNQDHRIVHQAALTAARPKPGCSVTGMYAFEVPSSTDWSFEYSFHPTVFVDISKTFDQKMEALKCYTSEVSSFPHPRSPEAIKALAMYRGSMVGVRAAEAFQLIRLVR